MITYTCPEHGEQQFGTLDWNSRGTTYDDGSFDFTAVFDLACGCKVREETSHDGLPAHPNYSVQRYRVEQRDDVLELP